MKGNVVTYVVCLLVLACAASCNKKIDRGLSFSGQVFNQHNQNPQAGINVSLFASELVQNGGITKLEERGTSTTDADGFFSFDFERASDIVYEIRLSGPDIFPETINVDPDDVLREKNFRQDFGVNVVSYARVRVVNKEPARSSDLLDIATAEDLGCACCSKTAIRYTGLADDEFICPVPAGKDVRFRAVRRDAEGLQELTVNVLCTKGDTCMAVLEY